MKHKIDSLFIFIISFLYLEILYRLVMNYSLFSINMINIVLFIVSCSIMFRFISSFFSDKHNKLIMLIILFFMGIYFSTQFVVYRIFGFSFDFSLLGTTDQIADFSSTGIVLIIQNILYVLLSFLPFVMSICFLKFIDTSKKSIDECKVIFLMSIVVYLLFIGSIKINKNEEYSAYKLYFINQNMSLSLKKLGVINTLFLDTQVNLFDVQEKVVVEEVKEVFDEPEEIDYSYNNLDIDFNSLIENSNDTLRSMHEYFLSDSGTLQNEYTGYFKDKNLILFMAESFNEIAVSEELTPTLYKLVNNGFVFDNFYTPTISSTIGGEFQELTGLVAASGFIKNWKEGTNTYPFGIANMFKNASYSTYAYHDHSYAFQNRNKYLKALGFDNFTACFNGLEKEINCKIWPESDVEMIEATVDDYINNPEPFMVFYATVSGHGEYNWGNKMSKKHQEQVNALPYSEPVKAYIACQMELDDALSLLIEKLTEAGKLDNTVIALVGDHYPYFLTIDEVNELSSSPKEGIISVNHSNFILWNNSMETVHIDKVGSQIDVLPTIYNAFGLPYDSRVIIGKDILSTEPGLAMFGDRSWVSDYGIYYTTTGEFIKTTDKEIPDNYIASINTKVSNKFNMSKLIMSQDYYKYIK